MTEHNLLTGPIPFQIGKLLALEHLDLGKWASINGVKKDSHPVRLSHTFLVLLDSSRMTADNEFTGPIPSEINYLWRLVVLDLREWAFIKCVNKDSHPVRLSHTFLF
jgi:hypothetical protein